MPLETTVAAAAPPVNAPAGWQRVLLVALALALMLGGPYGAMLRSVGGETTVFAFTPARALAYWAAWLVGVPCLIAAYRRPLNMQVGAARLLLHAALALGASTAHAVVFGLANAALTSVVGARHVVVDRTLISYEAARGLWDYALLLALVHVVAYVQAVRERDREAARQELVRARLEAEAARAEVAALQSQLHPHFLFNTLNSIAVLTTQDPPAAEAMVVQLGALLRTVIQTSQDHLVSVRRELDFVDRYLAIQGIRFGDRLHVELHVDDDVLDAAIPAMLIQPLIENAVRHAVEVAGEGTIVLRIQRAGDRVMVSVEDDGAPAAGVGLNAASTAAGTGIGLKNVERRLALLFGDRHRIDVRRRDAGGTIASVEMPCMAGS